MSIYILLLFLLLFLLINRHNKFYIYHSKSIVFLIICVLFLVCVFRSISVGTDYREYYLLFIHTDYQSIIMNYVDPGFTELYYARLTIIAQYLNNFLIIPSAVFIIGIFAIHLLGKEFHANKYTVLSFFVISGLYFQMFTALRQMIALGVAYIGLFLLFKYHHHIVVGFLLLILLVYIATEFHRTAIFVLIFLALPYIRYGKLTVIISGIITIALLLTGEAQRISLFLIHITPHYSEKYMGFSMSNKNSFKDLLIESVPIILQYCFLYVFISHNNITNKKDQFVLSGYLLYLIMFIGLDNNSIRRLQLYTLIFPILFSCMFLDGKYLYKNKLKYMINDYGLKILYMLTWIILYVGKLILTDRFGIVPYHLINLMKIFYN